MPVIRFIRAKALVQRILRAHLGLLKCQAQTAQAAVRSTEHNLARGRGETAAMQRQVEYGVKQRGELQEAMQAAQKRFAHELEQQCAATAAAQERHTFDMQRILLDVDRERSAAAKAQQELEQARRVATEQAEKHWAALAALQQERAQLGQRLGEVEGALALRKSGARSKKGPVTGAQRSAF